MTYMDEDIDAFTLDDEEPEEEDAEDEESL
jgi:hypothetical protein